MNPKFNDHKIMAFYIDIFNSTKFLKVLNPYFPFFEFTGGI